MKTLIMIVRLVAGLMLFVAAYQAWISTALLGDDLSLIGFAVEKLIYSAILAFAGIGLAILTTLDFSKD